MPPFFSEKDMYFAMGDYVLPRLQVLAENEKLLEHERRRFDRDEPPPYESSTDYDGVDCHQPAPPKRPLPPEFLPIMDPPLTVDERNYLVSHAEWQRPGERYKREWELESDRLSETLGLSSGSSVASKAVERIFESNAGGLRKGVIIHHNIKRRWQKLGVWNRKWGIPSRYESQPNDCIWMWEVRQQGMEI